MQFLPNQINTLQQPRLLNNTVMKPLSPNTQPNPMNHIFNVQNYRVDNQINY